MLAEIDTRRREVELVSRDNKRDLLFDQPSAFVRRERIHNVNHRDTGDGGNASQLSPQVSPPDPFTRAFDREHQRSAQNLNPSELERILQKIRELAIQFQAGNGRIDTEDLVQISPDIRINPSHTSTITLFWHDIITNVIVPYY